MMLNLENRSSLIENKSADGVIVSTMERVLQ